MVPHMKTPSTKIKAKAVKKTAVKKPTNKESKNQTKIVEKGPAKRDPWPVPYYQSEKAQEQDRKDLQKTMGFVMWRFRRYQKLRRPDNKAGEWIEAELKDPYHAEKNPRGVGYVEGFLMYRYPPGHIPSGCAYSMQEPITKTCIYYDLPAFGIYLGGEFGFPEGFSREQPNLNFLPVWRYYYPDQIVNMGSVVFRDEHKVSRPLPVTEAEKTMVQIFHYPKGFVKAGEEGDFSYRGRMQPARSRSEE